MSGQTTTTAIHDIEYTPPPLLCVQMTAAKKILRCSIATSNTVVLRAELGVYPLKTSGHMRDIRGIERMNKNENVLARPSVLHENVETAISCR